MRPANGVELHYERRHRWGGVALVTDRSQTNQTEPQPAGTEKREGSVFSLTNQHDPAQTALC